MTNRSDTASIASGAASVASSGHKGSGDKATIVASPEPAGAAPQASRPHLWHHVLALAAFLLVLLPVMSPRSAFTADEGAYALQADALAHGAWAYDYRAAGLDPDGSAFPLLSAGRHGHAFYPYIQHPAYPAMLRGISPAVGSTLGLHLLALAGTVGTAVAAWLLAAEIDPRLRRNAFWLAALGPVLANGFLVWAHSLSAAVAGLTLVAVIRAERRGSSRLLTAGTAAGAAGGVLLRSEGLLFAMALAVAVACVRQRSVGSGHLGRRAGAVAGAIGAIAVPALLAALAERAWVHHIVGGAYENFRTRSEGTPWLAGRVSAAWHDLFEGPLATGRNLVVSLVVLIALVGLGVVARRRPLQARWAIGGGALLASGISAAVVLANPGTPVPGLLAAWPVVLVGLIAVPWRRLGTSEVVVGATIALFAAAVVATEYSVGAESSGVAGSSSLSWRRWPCWPCSASTDASRHSLVTRSAMPWHCSPSPWSPAASSASCPSGASAPAIPT